jgi:hypothetical protein
MKHELKDLDQFFAAARSEAPIVSDQDVLAMLEQADAANVADAVTTEVMSNSPIGRFISALKHQQGGMIMTGLGLTAVTGLLVTGYLLTSPEQPTSSVTTPKATSPKLEQHASIAPQLASKQEEPATDPINVASTMQASEVDEPMSFREPAQPELPVPPAAPIPPVPVDSTLWANVRIEAVQPIVIAPGEVEQLGVNKEATGKVFVVHEAPGGVKLKMTFPPEGMQIRTPRRNGGAEVNYAMIPPEAPIAPIMPTMVTDTKGKKLAFFFKMDTAADGFSMSSMALTQIEGDSLGHMPFPPGMRNMPPAFASMNMIHVDDEEEYELTIDGEKNSIERKPTKRRKVDWSNFININKGDPEMDSLLQLHGGQGKKFMTFSSDSSFGKNFKFDFDFSQFDSANFDFDIDFDFQQHFDFDSLHKNAEKYREEALKYYQFNVDSMRTNMAEIQRQAEIYRNEAMQHHKEALKIRLNADSIRMQVMRELKKLGIDSSMKQFNNREIRMNKNIIINRGNIKDGPENMRELPMPIAVVDFSRQYQMIDKLIPVQVLAANAELEFNKNGLIFWYMPDKKFEEKAPAGLREATDVFTDVKKDRPNEKLAVNAKQGAIAEPAIFPNPSPGQSTFKYTLAEPRAVSIAIHDLLGKQLMVVASAENKSSGTFEKELDLASLEAGVYLLVMVTDRGEQITQRLVIER